MRCPLCSGPLHAQDKKFECEFGHRVDRDELSTAAELQLSEALWMAIEALANEADVLRAVGGEEGRPYADEAELQATRLREFGRDQALRVSAL